MEADSLRNDMLMSSNVVHVYTYVYRLASQKAEIKIENKEKCSQQNENKCAHQTFEYAD